VGFAGRPGQPEDQDREDDRAGYRPSEEATSQPVGLARHLHPDLEVGRGLFLLDHRRAAGG
jgi:hypothetical protein